MITVAKLRRKPHQFRALTGLSVFEFDTLLAEFAPAYETARLSRRCQAGRKVGCGRFPTMPGKSVKFGVSLL